MKGVNDIEATNNESGPRFSTCHGPHSAHCTTLCSEQRTCAWRTALCSRTRLGDSLCWPALERRQAILALSLSCGSPGLQPPLTTRERIGPHSGTHSSDLTGWCPPSTLRFIDARAHSTCAVPCFPCLSFPWIALCLHSPPTLVLPPPPPPSFPAVCSASCLSTRPWGRAPASTRLASASLTSATPPWTRSRDR